MRRAIKCKTCNGSGIESYEEGLSCPDCNGMQEIYTDDWGWWRMSCEDCDAIQDMVLDKNVPETVPIAYFRVGAANVAVLACGKHLKEVQDKLRNWGSKVMEILLKLRPDVSKEEVQSLIESIENDTDCLYDMTFDAELLKLYD